MSTTLFTFDSSRAAIKADTLTSKNGLKVKVIATPEYISSECGITLEVADELSDNVAEILDNSNIEYKRYECRSTTI